MMTRHRHQTSSREEKNGEPEEKVKEPESSFSPDRYFDEKVQAGTPRGCLDEPRVTGPSDLATMEFPVLDKGDEDDCGVALEVDGR